MVAWLPGSLALINPTGQEGWSADGRWKNAPSASVVDFFSTPTRSSQGDWGAIFPCPVLRRCCVLIFYDAVRSINFKYCDWQVCSARSEYGVSLTEWDDEG